MLAKAAALVWLGMVPWCTLGKPSKRHRATKCRGSDAVAATAQRPLRGNLALFSRHHLGWQACLTGCQPGSHYCLSACPSSDNIISRQDVHVDNFGKLRKCHRTTIKACRRLGDISSRSSMCLCEAILSIVNEQQHCRCQGCQLGKGMPVRELLLLVCMRFVLPLS